MNANTENGGLAGLFHMGHLASMNAVKHMRDALDQQKAARRSHRDSFTNGVEGLAYAANKYVKAIQNRRYTDIRKSIAEQEYAGSRENAATLRKELLASKGIETNKDGSLSFPDFG